MSSCICLPPKMSRCAAADRQSARCAGRQRFPWATLQLCAPPAARCWRETMGQEPASTPPNPGAAGLGGLRRGTNKGGTCCGGGMPSFSSTRSLMRLTVSVGSMSNSISLPVPRSKGHGLAAPAAPAEPRARACQRPQTRLPRCAGRSPAGNPARTRRQRGRADSNAAPAPARGAPRTHGPLEPPCKPRGCWREPRVSRENVGRARGQAPARSESPPGARARGRRRRRRLTCQRLDLDLHRAAPPLNPVYRSAVVVSRPSWRVHELKLGSWLQQFASRLRLLQRARAAHSARPPAGGRAPP